MKLIYLLFFSAFLSSNAKSQFSINSNYTLALPLQSMKKNINAMHQFRMQGLYSIPSHKNLSFGIDVGAGTYANMRMPTTFNFGNGNPTSTFVNYSSNTALANAVIQYDLIRKSPIIPYVTVKGGVQRMGSRIYIEDPLDIDGCAPLENKNIIKDHTPILSYGGGVKFDFNKIFVMSPKGKHFLDIGFVSVRGGEIEYINTKKLKAHDHNSNTQAPTGEEGKPLNMRFINVQSNLIHDHMVAELFTTPIRLFEIKLGYTYKF